MTIEIKVPMLPESVADATIAAWHKKPGDVVKRDENLVDLETDKVVLEVPAPTDGVLAEIVQVTGSTVTAGMVIAKITEGVSAASTPVSSVIQSAPAAVSSSSAASTQSPDLSPAVRREVQKEDINLSGVQGSGKRGRITTSDLHPSSDTAPLKKGPATREEKRVPMTRLRQRIAQRLLEVKQTTAMLTTFNEVNLQAVNDLRAKYKDAFEKKYGVRLGYMSFFTQAVIEALKQFPDVNASIDGSDIVYHGYFDIGIAVSTDRGLVVPVLRDADSLSMAGIETSIKNYADKARLGSLTLEEMTGGTFTITNGGAFGSLLSTPILNPPQSAILGMHGIQERPIVENGQIVIRPMMYLALSYDHRIIDGKQSVLFLKTVKEFLEYPGRIGLGL